MYRYLCVIAVAAWLGDAWGTEPVRRWRVKRDGRTLFLEGQFIGVRDNCVGLRLTTGVVIGTYTLSEFSESDLAYIREAVQRLRDEAPPPAAASGPRKALTSSGSTAAGLATNGLSRGASWPKRGDAADEEVPGEATPAMIEAEYLRVAKKCNFTIEYAPKLPNGPVAGTPVSRDEMTPLLEKFFTAVDVFPVRFLKRSGLNTVVFCHDLTLNGIPAGGVAAGNLIYLNSTFGSHVIYHELFHVADPSRDNPKWTKLNNRRFAYVGSAFAPAEGSRKELKRAADTRGDAALLQDFASDYAQSNEVEDRAETFALMVANPQAFAEQCKSSRVLAEKGALVKDIVRDFSPAMNKDFWAFIADSNDDSRLADFLKRAKLNDLRKRQKKSLVNSGYTTN